MATTENTYTTSNANTTDFAFTFPYMKEADVKVDVAGVTQSTTAYSFQNATTLRFGTAPASGVVVRVYRSTDDSGLTSTFYPGSAIRSSDLNDNFTQSLYSSQETSEKASDALRATDAFIATTSDEGATWVTAGNNTNASTDPKGIGYAVTTSEAADGKADAAVETADDAELLVHTYVADGNGNLKGDGISPNPQGVKYAVETAEDAEEVADEARDTYAIPAKQATDALVGTTTDNGQTWTLRGDGISPNPQGVAYAVGKADDAKDSADDALEATDALVGKKVNNVWVTRGHADNANGDPESGVGKALDDSANAVSDADAAKLATDTYVHDGTSLKGDGLGSNPKGVKYAVTQVDDWIINGDGLGSNQQGVPYAVTTANQAAAAVANSTTYTLKTNKTTFEATVFDDTDAHQAWEIGDSTGISSTYTSFIDGNGILIGQTVNGVDGTGTAKTISGIPTTPIFDSGLSSRFSYDHANNAFAWVGYWVNDAEDRYGGSTVQQNLIEIDSDFSIKNNSGVGTHHALSVGPITITDGTTLTIPANSRYVVL